MHVKKFGLHWTHDTRQRAKGIERNDSQGGLGEAEEASTALMLVQRAVCASCLCNRAKSQCAMQPHDEQHAGMLCRLHEQQAAHMARGPT